MEWNIKFLYLPSTQTRCRRITRQNPWATTTTWLLLAIFTLGPTGIGVWNLSAKGTKYPPKPGAGGQACREIGIEYKSYTADRTKCGFPTFINPSLHDPYLVKSITESAETYVQSISYSGVGGSGMVNSRKAACDGTFAFSLSSSWQNISWVADSFYTNTYSASTWFANASYNQSYYPGNGTGSGMASPSLAVVQDTSAGVRFSNLGGMPPTSFSSTGTITFTPGGVGSQTQTYTDGICASPAPDISGTLELTPVVSVVANISETVREISTSSIFTPAKQTETLSVQYDTAKLFSLATADLSQCSPSDWGKGVTRVTTSNPAYCAEGDAIGNAYRNLSTDEETLGLRRLEYRLKVNLPRGEQTLIEWVERQTDLAGNIIRDTKKQKWLTGTGDVQYVGPFPIEPPSVNGYIKVVILSNEPIICPCILGGTEATGGRLFVESLLGRTEFGESAGKLFVTATNPSPALGTALSLNFLGLDNGAQVISTNGVLRQVKVAQGLADVISNSVSQYQVKFYTNAGSMSGGLYVPSGSAVTTMQVNLVGGSTNHVRFTVTGMGADVIDYYWSDDDQAWTTTMGDENYIEQRLWNTNSLLETNIVYNADLVELARTKTVYSDLAGGAGRVVTEMIDDPAGAALLTKLFYINDTNSPNHGRLWMKVFPEGKWESYRYDSQSRVTNIIQQVGNSATNSADSSNRLLIYDYSTQGTGDVGTNDLFTPRLTVEKLLGQEIRRSYTVMLTNGFKEVVCPLPGLTFNDSLNEVTTTTICTNGTFIDRPLLVNHPDGTITGYIYSRTSTEETVTVGMGQPDGTGTNVYNGTKSVTVTGVAGQTISRSVYQVQAGTPTLIDEETYQYNDPMFRSHTITYLDGRTEDKTYDCCGLASTTDKDGTVTDFTHDALHREIATTRLGIKRTNILDAVGRTLVSKRIGTDGSTIILNQNQYDSAGRLVASTNALLGKTTFLTTTNGSSEKVVTTTNPDGGTRIETYFKDGTLKSLTGTAVQPVRYEYGVESDGGYYREYAKAIKLDGTYADTSEWTKTYTDGAGRTYKTAFAGSGSPYQQSWYNNQGQLWKQRDPDGVITLTSYDAQGRPYYQAVDVNQNDVINTNGLDRVTFTLSDVVSAHSTTVRRNRTYAHIVDSSGSFDLLGMSEQSVNGLKSWQTAYRDTSTAVQSSAETSYGGGGSRTVTATNPDGSYSISAYSYGELQSVTHYAQGGAQVGQTTYGQDYHGRVSMITDARNGAASMTFNNADQPLTTTSPAPGTGVAAQVTATTYDNMGRATGVTYPDGNQTSREYFLTGLLKKSYGSRTYPVEYSYDAQGKMQTMKTWQNYAGNTGTNTTTWVYNSERGWMTNKVYSDGNGPRYTYTPGGRLKTRVWARGITTTYKYGFDDGGSIKHGDLTVTDYSDSTPDVTLAFDRLGRVKTVTDVGSRSYAYNLAGQATNDTYTVSTYGFGSTNHFAYDAYLHLTGITNVTLGLNHNYTYDTAGRLSTATDLTNNVTYTYHANSSLPATLAFKQTTTLRLNQTKAFDKLNRLTDITSTPQASGALPMSYSYQYNSANQRIQTRLADGSYWLYEYDALGQVISGKRFWADGTPVAGQQFEYGLDDIGNRKTTKAGGDQTGSGSRSATYTANGLNQYSSRTVPGAYDILGAATATSAVTVNGSSPYRKGEYFWKEVTASNGSGPLWQTNTVIVSGGATNGGNVLVPPATQTFTHDLDGNLTNDLVWVYLWDGENRLVQMSNVTTVASAARRKLDFNYDHQGRRFRKVMSTWNGSSWVTAQTNVFHYHGWNVLGDFVSTSNFRQYLWGSDLSGSLQGAGGVGGLIAVRETNQVHFVAYDGNGNVAGLVNAADGTVSANYEYGPFGESIRASGVFAKNNPYRFSTKYQDAETDLLYYGYRYLNTSTGRWLNRDFIGEKGGLNEYCLLSNGAVGAVDYLGMLNVIRLGFMGADDKFAGDWLLWLSPQQIFGSLDLAGASRYVLKQLDTNGNGRIDECDDAADIRITGFSWGGFSALKLARALNGLKFDKHKQTRIGLLDPVLTARPHEYALTKNIYFATVVYQRNGCYGRRCPGLSVWYRGEPLPGAINVDVTNDRPTTPIDGVPVDQSPDHVHLMFNYHNYATGIGYVLWFIPFM